MSSMLGGVGPGTCATREETEELEYMIKTLQMWEFGSWQDAMSRTARSHPRRMWVDRTKNDDANECVGCRLVAREFTPKREGPRDDLFAVMPPLEAKQAPFASVAGVRKRRRDQGLADVKLFFVDVKKAHFNARCDKEELVELPDGFEEHGWHNKVRR